MPGLVPGIHVSVTRSKKDVDGRDEPGHDEKRVLPKWLDRKRAKAVSGVWRGRRIVMAAIAMSLLLPVGAGHANWLTDVFKPKPDKSQKHIAAPKHPARARPAASSKPRTDKPHTDKRDAPSPAKPVAATCTPSKFRIVVDVGHTAASEGAISARNVAEFVFNLRLAKRIEETLKGNGFAGARLLVTEGKARRSLVRRVEVANRWPADLLLSIHHDSVPSKFLEDWEFEGKKRHFSDRFSGYSVFVSRRNPDFKTSLAFAEAVAKEMKAKGLDYARQYSEPVMGRYRHPLLNKETGVYSYDELIVLRKTRMPAVLLEAGSIINRDEELKMDSPERRDITSHAVAAAVKAFCDARAPAADPPK
jgi:N-acetylmuramoyl-L-alanine amidase